MSLLLKLRLIVFSFAIFCIYCGVRRDEDILIFNKAVRICMECIGLG